MNIICNMCPHKCNIDREKNKGRCTAGVLPEIGGVSLHMFEEPCISGEHGSGTVFFSKCNLNCVFCQNYEISNLGNGKAISVDKLADIFIEQQSRKAENINLVSPTIYSEQIIEAIKIARKKGLNIPIIYNSNGYENIDTLKKFNGLIDVYLPDLKYYYDDIASKYSKVNNYFDIATQAIIEMYNQVGAPKFDNNGMIKKGLIIRHLVLPNNIENSKKILEWIKNNINEEVYISIMTQYFPTYKASNYPEIDRKLTKAEYDEVENYIEKIGIPNGYMQDYSEEDEEQYVPNWNF